MKGNLSNILITGTPGTGKSSLCKNLISLLNEEYVYLNIGDYVKENNLTDEFDHERNCYVLNEDALIDHLESFMRNENKKIIFDYHGCDLFPGEWFKGVFVLRTSNDILYQRLSQRNYSESKINENIQCEIFQVILDEARDAFDELEHLKIFELQNNNEQDQLDNLETILNFIKS